MALVDPNIALSYKGVQLQDPLDQYSKASAAQFNALKMDEIMREREALSQIQSTIASKGGPTDLRAAAQAMFKTGRPEFVKTAVSILERLDNQDKFSEYLRQFEGPAANALAPAAASAPATASAEAPAPAPANALAAVPAPAPAETPPANALAAPPSAAKAAPPSAAKAAPSSTKELERRYRMVSNINTPAAKAEAQLILKQIENEFRATLPPDTIRTMLALGFTLDETGYRAYQSAQRPPPQPRNPIAVLQNGRPTYVDPANAIGQTPLTPAAIRIEGLGPGKEAPAPSVTQIQDPDDPTRMITIDARTYKGGGVGSPGVIGLAGKTPGSAPGLSDKDRQKRDAEYPKATQSVKSFETKSDLFIRDLERLRDDPGLNQITGPIYGRTPSVSQAGSRAQALYDKIFAKGGFQALQDMREASKTGGALGNVSNEEGRRLERSVVGGLDRTQNIKDVRRGINDLIDEIRTSKSRVREAYESTYDYRTQQGAATSPAPASGGWSVVR